MENTLASNGNFSFVIWIANIISGNASDFINCQCKGSLNDNDITVKMKKKKTTPLFKSNDVFQKSWDVPWLGNKRVHYDWMC